MVLGPKMRMRGHLNPSWFLSPALWEVVREMKRHQGPSLHLAGYSLWNEFAMEDVEEAETQLPLLPSQGESGRLTRTASPFTIARGIRFG